MASTRSRQRKLAREKFQRQMVRRADRQRRRRQMQAAIGAFLVLGLIIAGTAWLTGWFESEPEQPSVASDRCNWQQLDPTAMPNRVDVGEPPANPPETGTRTMTMDLAAEPGAGAVAVSMDVAADPCAVASTEYLAGQGFFNDSTCHAVTEEGALRCGDPSGSGVGGPTYAFYGENLPEVPDGADASDGGEPPVTYPRGTVAVANDAGYNSSQFLIFFEDYKTDEPIWPVLGQVTDGLDVVEEIGAAGTDGESTAPAQEVRINTLTVTDPEADDGSGLAES